MDATGFYLIGFRFKKGKTGLGFSPRVAARLKSLWECVFFKETVGNYAKNELQVWKNSY